ncbi:MAG: hypothetical protein QG656_1489, partial [Candidatus Hydrogenedentes bacterium]|nr:hypothetical protein [Candidatus Hydrogenedentota bacterium]
EWDFGAFHDVPGQSVYSVQTDIPPFDPKHIPEQMPKLPEAKRSRDADMAGQPEGTSP